MLTMAHKVDAFGVNIHVIIKINAKKYEYIQFFPHILCVEEYRWMGPP